jgi:hypothetical protein
VNLAQYQTQTESSLLGQQKGPTLQQGWILRAVGSQLKLVQSKALPFCFGPGEGSRHEVWRGGAPAGPFWKEASQASSCDPAWLDNSAAPWSWPAWLWASPGATGQAPQRGTSC